MIDKGLLKLLGGNVKYVFSTVALMVLSLLANVAVTSCICWAIELLIKEADAAEYVYPLAVGIAAIALRYASTRFTGSLKDRLGRNVKKDLRGKLYDKIVRLNAKDADGVKTAGLTQISLEGIEQLDLYYSSYLPQFFFSMIAPIILFAICVAIDWRVSLMLIACVPLIPLSIVAVSKYAKKVFAKYWGKYTSMGDVFLDSIQGLKELKIFSADKLRHEEMNVSAEEFRKITMKVLVMQLASVTIMDLVAFGGAGAGIALTVVGAEAGMNPVAALFLVLIAVEFFLPLRSLGSAFHIAMNGASAGRKIMQILKLEEPVWGEGEVGSASIEFENVTFSYDGKRNALNGVSAKFPEKGMSAIVGESGCGKSTMVSLIAGAYRPCQGEVRVGGSKMETLSLSSYYSRLAIVSYNSYIFNQSVRENFKLAKPDCSDSEIADALESVKLSGLISADDGGLDKVISEDGNNVSGGQKQRLALAINLIADKDVYVFDEATSNIDIESEAVIMKNIKRLSQSKNVIVISHRLENVVQADNIYFMKNGEIKESGTHSQLVAKNGGYAAMYRMQKELEEGYKTALSEVAK
jgi:ABC-type transport system involved in cytochrome bd biosynthesis fused ATPase/permease subunit